MAFKTYIGWFTAFNGIQIEKLDQKTDTGPFVFSCLLFFVSCCVLTVICEWYLWNARRNNWSYLLILISYQTEWQLVGCYWECYKCFIRLHTTCSTSTASLAKHLRRLRCSSETERELKGSTLMKVKVCVALKDLELHIESHKMNPST